MLVTTVALESRPHVLVSEADAGIAVQCLDDIANRLAVRNIRVRRFPRGRRHVVYSLGRVRDLPDANGSAIARVEPELRVKAVAYGWVRSAASAGTTRTGDAAMHNTR